MARFVTTTKAFFLPSPGRTRFTTEYFLRSDAARCLVIVDFGGGVTCCFGSLEDGCGLSACSFFFAHIRQFPRRRSGFRNH
jgi:hypothetical protein